MAGFSPGAVAWAWLGLLVLFGCGSGAQARSPAPYVEREEVRAYIRQVAREHGFEQQALHAVLAGARYRQDIIDKISRPAEKAWTWARYRRLLVDPGRVRKGLEFWQVHEAALRRAAAEYGVAPQIVVAILGVETRYGEVMGDFRVLDALATLGFDYPPRADFFRGQLTELLLLAREEGKDPGALLGSYAGAMGFGQFIPSSFRDFAVDFDGDGLRDIWTNPTDAIGSIANYFARHGWQGAGHVAIRVPQPERVADAEQLANRGLEPSLGPAQLRELGIAANGLTPQEKAALFRLEGEHGIEYWLGLHDFYVITRYNRSHMYALAVFQLSEEIKAGRDAGI